MAWLRKVCTVCAAVCVVCSALFVAVLAYLRRYNVIIYKMAIGTLLGVASAASGVAGAIFGSKEQREAAREQRRLLAEQRARNEAWYNRNYYEDYLNSVGAQNAMKRVRDWWSKENRQARARAAVSGGTPEQAAAVAEAGGRAMADTMGNLAAQGEANKRAVDAQKAQMDANVAAQEAAIADARQQAGANLLSNGINLAVSGANAAMEQGLKVPNSIKGAEGMQLTEEEKLRVANGRKAHELD